MLGAGLFAPARETTLAGQAVYERGSELINGALLAQFGWVGPLAFCFAWYANIPLTICVVALATGKAPGRRLSVTAAAVAATVLLPFVVYTEVDGWRLAIVRGPAVWCWLAAFSVPLATAFVPPRGSSA